MISFMPIVNYFIELAYTKADEDTLVDLSHLKLQKLLYYAQGWYLAENEEPLFSNPLLAWQHGPVVKEAYYQFTDYGKDVIPLSATMATNEVLTENQKRFLDSIYETYGQFSAWRLREMTHDEEPWKETPQSDEIPHSKLKQFFKSLSDNG